jgi:hypothetical protein
MVPQTLLGTLCLSSSHFNCEASNSINSRTLQVQCATRRTEILNCDLTKALKFKLKGTDVAVNVESHEHQIRSLKYQL